jgi:hypothetical protein
VPHTFVDGEIPTGQDFQNYLSAKGLLKTKRTSAGDTVIGDVSTEQLIDTIDNVTVGPGCSLNRAVKLTWAMVGTVSMNATHTYTVRGYWKAASSFGAISGATLFTIGAATFDWTNFNDELQTPIFLASLAPATVFSFGLSIQRVGGSGAGYVVRGSSTIPRLALLEDIGEGTLV